MRLVRIAIATVNTTVGAHRRNADKVIALARDMSASGATLAVFPEQVIGGYPAEDWVLWKGFVEAQWTQLERFADGTRKLPTAFILGLVCAHQGLRYNCAAVVAHGKVLGVVPKEKLPNYSVFYEGRTLARGAAGLAGEVNGVPFGDLLFRFDFGVVGTEVCEDAWSPEGPSRRRCYAGAEVICNVSASPYRVGIAQTRAELLATRASDGQCTLVYANALGGNDGLIFDGGGFIHQNGRVLMEAPRFREGSWAQTVDLDRATRLRSENTTWREDQTDIVGVWPLPKVIEIPANVFSAQRKDLQYPVPASANFFLPDNKPSLASPRSTACEELLEALTLGLGDYYEKTGAFRGLGVALSGGRDSLLTLLIAHRYAQRVKPDAPGTLIRAFYFPSRVSSAQTRDAAETVCRELGVSLEVVSIEDAVERELAATRTMLSGGEPTPLTLQNIQARLRAQRMWNWSNSSGALFLQTGNMSERAVGYTTIGGDLMGGLGVLANVPKTVVMMLIDHLQEKLKLSGIQKVLARPAGPELAPNQVGEEELMPFPVLDACFHLFAEEKLQPTEVLSALAGMFPARGEKALRADVEKFHRLFLQNIYKWVQAPLSLHVGNLDLDRERALQLPVVSKADWLDKP
ncbi:MAG: NAD(+) synthase [Myxococcaceae bacterium]